MNQALSVTQWSRRGRALLLLAGLIVTTWGLTVWILTDSTQALGMGTMTVSAVAIVLVSEAE